MTGETDGTVFEFHADNARPFRAEDLEAIENYKPFFEPRTHTLDADTTLYTPIQQLLREANGPDDAVWRSRVEQYLDLNSFMAHVGIEQFMSGNDGILGNFGMNNFYLYRFQGSTRHDCSSGTRTRSSSTCRTRPSRPPTPTSCSGGP